MPPQKTAQYVGIHTLQIVQDVYTHLEPEDLRAIVASLPRMLGSASSPDLSGR